MALYFNSKHCHGVAVGFDSNPERPVLQSPPRDYNPGCLGAGRSLPSEGAWIANRSVNAMETTS